LYKDPDLKIIILQGGKVMNSRKVFGMIVCAISVLALSTAITLGQNDPAAYRLITGDAEESPPMNSGTTMDEAQGFDSCNPGCCDAGCSQRCYCPRWTASADFIILDRLGTKSQTLVRRVIRDEQTSGITDVLNSDDFHQGFYGGPRVGLIRHGDCCYDIELLYFQIDGWKSSRSVAPELDSLPDGATHPSEEGLLFSVPGYNIYTYDSIRFDYTSKLYNAEINVRWNPCCRVTMLAGFRWVELRENLEGSFMPYLFESFWNTNTNNNLYGFQIGADAKVVDRGCFSIDGLVKAGIFGNHAEQSSFLRGEEYTGFGSASTNHTAFLGELGLQCKYQVSCHLTLRAGYEAIWLQGVALAPGQIPVTNVYENEVGINTSGGVFYHGATAGFEYSF
jgi:hypothetical protein